MILNEPNVTPLDLRFRLFGTDVRVHPFFWLMSVFLGWNVTEMHILSESGLAELAIWIGCVFFSILLHEFGHVWMGRMFGTDGYIALHSMGGLAIGANSLDRRWQRIFVSAAGPAIQLLLYVGIVAFVWMRVPDFPAELSEKLQQPTILGMPILGFATLPPAARLTLLFLVEINLFWPILNLLPIWPLDGGQITREVSTGVSPYNGLLVSLWISLVVSGTLAVNALVGQGSVGKPFIPYAPVSLFSAFFFALFAIGSWQAIQAVQQSRERVWEDDALPWER